MKRSTKIRIRHRGSEGSDVFRQQDQHEHDRGWRAPQGELEHQAAGYRCYDPRGRNPGQVDGRCLTSRTHDWCLVPGKPRRTYLPRLGDPGTRPSAGCTPEHRCELSFRQWIAGPHAEPVRGHRRVIDGTSFRYRIVALPIGVTSRLSPDRPSRLPRLVRRVAPAPA